MAQTAPVLAQLAASVRARRAALGR